MLSTVPGLQRARSQELPLFARLGPHLRTLIDDAIRDGELFEYWVHEASLVLTDQVYLRHEAGSGAGPYVTGTLLAVREATRRVGVTRGLDTLLF